MIRIISDGTTYGTRVETASGEQIKGISRIEILPLDATSGHNSVVEARVTIEMVKLDLAAMEAYEVKEVQHGEHGEIESGQQ